MAAAIRKVMTVIDLAFTIHVPARRWTVVTRRRSAVLHGRTAMIMVIPVLGEGGNRRREERERREAS